MSEDFERNLRPVDAFGIEDPFESLLDEESDEEFGHFIPKERVKGAVLKEWSAQDFSNIYVRFRPHLERHARRFLSDQGRVDEVVQDAFLYLMVTLPELDSEIGVLRFMKWKVRLLCLDVIRASGKAYVNNLDDQPELASSEPEVSTGLEQAEDAAIVRLALSKLNPRHREVLLASIYEEKSTEEIAAQVGLSENATRQLVFRARAAFKKALLGDDVNTEGMSVSAILSVAARKAAQDVKKVGAQAMIFVLFLMLAITVWPAFNGSDDDTPQVVAEGPAPVPQPTTTTEGNTQTVEPTAAPTGSGQPSAPAEINPVVKPTPTPTPSGSQSNTPSPSSSVMTGAAADRLFRSALTTWSSNASPKAGAQRYSLNTASGLSVSFLFDPTANNQVTDLRASVLFEGKRYQLVTFASATASQLGEDGNEHVLTTPVVDYVLDENGKKVELVPFDLRSVAVELTFDFTRTTLLAASVQLTK